MPLIKPKLRLGKGTLLKCLLMVVFAVTALYIQREFTTRVNYPFIDEIFHLRQCQTYCHGKFHQWDNKITTPPGLYILGVLYVKFLEVITGNSYLCMENSVLRSFNLIGGLVVLPLIVNSIKRSNSARTKRNDLWSINIVAQPILFTYYFLFYTDVWSTILILGSLALALKRWPVLSAVVGFLSLWLRQTNIIWLAFIVSVYIDTPSRSTSVNRVVEFVQRALKSWVSLVPYILTFGLFVVFLKVNGGITFGDKQNHQVQAHLVQVFYCFAFVNLFTLPVWFSRRRLTAYMNFLVWNNNGFNLAVNVLSLVAINFIIEKFTIVHPFLLADNRHFTFYIFKRLLNVRYSWVATVPFYHFCTWNIYYTLTTTNKLSFITIASYLVATILTLVPSPLFEPRYYIVPLVIFRLYSKPEVNSQWIHVAEFVWLNLINFAALLVFFVYEFEWDSEPGILQRIIW